MAILIEEATHPAEIFTCSTASPGELQRVTAFNAALFNELEVAVPEYMPYTGAEDWPIDGWILKPPGFDAKKKYPLVVEIHNVQQGGGRAIVEVGSPRREAPQDGTFQLADVLAAP